MIQSTFAVVRRQPPPAFSACECVTLDVLRAAFEGSAHGVVVSAEDGTILFSNVRASKMFNYQPEQLVGRPLSRLLPDAVPPANDVQWTEFWKHPRSAAMTADRTSTGIAHDGVRVPAEISLSAFDDGSTRLVIASIVDISERLNLEARLAAMTNAHLGFQRLDAMDREAVGKTIVDGLRQIEAALQLDWSAVWRWGSGRTDASPLQHCVQPSSPPAEPLPVASIPFVAASLKAGESCCFGKVDDLPNPDREAFRRHGLRSAAVLPLAPAREGEGVLDALVLGSTTREQEWPPAIIEHLRLIAGAISQALARRASDQALQEARDEVTRLRDRVALETAELRREVKVLKTSRPVVLESAAIQKVLQQIEQVSPTPATVLLLGETGTGKEVMAQAIHDLSPRHRRPMIRVSCAAIPTALIESELFGRERGAYTGALSRQVGRFEAANQSTLFLDEIGELPMEVQVKLLRVLQERVIERLGSTQTIKVDVRIITATNRNLEDAVRDKTFREDLYYRLNVFPVTVPPLRERVEDIPALVWSFIDEFSSAFGKTIDSISKESMSELQRYPWPGNVRELRNVIERATIVATGRKLVVSAPRTDERPLPHTAMTMTELEVEHIRAVLETTNWRVRGSGGAAERLGLKPTTLESRMVRLGIARRKVG